MGQDHDVTRVPPTVTSSTTRLDTYWAELAAVDVVMVRSSRVTVPTGSVADAPISDQIPAQRVGLDPVPGLQVGAVHAANAWVQSVLPSPTAPNRVTGKTRAGKRGRRTEATMRSAARSAWPC